MSEREAREQLAREILYLVVHHASDSGYYSNAIPDAIVAIERYDNRPELVGYNTAGNPADAVFAAVCQCGEPVVQGSCPACGAWHGLEGRR